MTSEVPFQDVVDFQEGPGIMARDFRQGGVPLIRLAGLTGISLLEGCNYLDPDMVEQKWSHFRLHEGDTLISTSASLGRVARVGKDAVGAVPYTGIIRMRPRDERLDSEFIQYLVTGNHFQQQVEAMGAGSVMRHFGPTHLRTMTLMVPSLAEQRAISDILRAFDNKIDSNRRLAAHLEESAATMFHARFVDFVGAEKFEEGDVGGIPRGWRPGALSDLARFVNGKAFTKHANDRGRPILRIKDLNHGVGQNTHHSDIDAADEHVARDRDILFAWSGSLDVYRWSGPESLINQHIFKVLPDGYPPWFVYRWINQHMADFRSIARDKATTMGHIQRRHLSEAAVPIPDVAAITAARDALDPIDNQQGVLAAEIQTLRELRGALLSKLVSGEIQVDDSHDTEEAIGPVAEQLAAGIS